ncbi:MAG TPA: 6-aminohexanoate hydrolase, partial [Gemmatimonadota bacterium]|nr:6-aminohexanoate hydrolase [Gemmatimonadota bacterium]
MTLPMPLAVLLALAIALSGANELPTELPASPNPPVADTLVGLWKAKRWFGPQARGTLVIERSESAFRADMMGATLPVRVEDGVLSFTLPGEQGTFRGRLQDGGAIRGHWFPPRPLAFGGHPTPVVLTPDGADRWTGQVVPFDDVFTFYLLVRERP